MLPVFVVFNEVVSVFLCMFNKIVANRDKYMPNFRLIVDLFFTRLIPVKSSLFVIIMMMDGEDLFT